MSLLNDFLNTIGHTINSLAQAVGADASFVETVVNDLDYHGINIFAVPAKMGLSPVDFLRGIVDIMKGDPHQQFLHYLIAPVKPMNDSLSQISHQWTQFASLHQETIQTINGHIGNLFAGSGTESYSGPAADTLWETHQSYQQYFTVLVDHAQVQQVRHTTLGGHVSDYLSQMPNKVYSLSTPMAALGVLSFHTLASFSPPRARPLGDQSQIQIWIMNLEEAEANIQDAAEASPPPIDEVLEAIAFVLQLIIWILDAVNLLQIAISGHQTQQKNIQLPKPPAQPTLIPLNKLTPTQLHLYEEVKVRLGYDVYNDAEIEALILAGYQNPDTIAAIMEGGTASFNAFNDPKIAGMMNMLPPSVQLLIVSQATTNNYSKEQVTFVLSCITKTTSVAASENVVFTNTNGETSSGHTLLQHVGVPDAVLEERVSKGPTSGGATFASTFPDEVTAQAGVDMVIAKSSKLQQLIKAGVLGTQATDKQCVDTANYGHGFKKNAIKTGRQVTYGPPIRYDNLHCVVVTISIGPGGIPLITTAYPSL